MKIPAILILGFPIYLALFGCSKPKPVDVPRVAATVIDSLVIPIDSNIRPSNLVTEYFKAGTSNYIRSFSNNNLMVTVDLDSVRYDTCRFEKDGPDGIEYASASTTISLSDSILIQGSNPFQLTLFSGAGKKLNTYILPDSTELRRRGVYIVNGAKWKYWRGSAISLVYPEQDFRKKSAILNARAFGRFDLSSGKGRAASIQIPEEAWRTFPALGVNTPGSIFMKL